MASEGKSPTTAYAPLEYFTVDSYDWPKEPPRPKRPRLATEEQRRRHRDHQKQFMQRKRAQFESLRQEAALLELKLQYLKGLQEEKKLLNERRRLDALQQVQFSACINEPRPASPIRLDATICRESQNELDMLLVDLLFSL